MDNMIVVALMVVAMIVANPFLKASETKKVAAASKTEAPEDDTDSSDQEDTDTDEDAIMMDDEDNTEKN